MSLTRREFLTSQAMGVGGVALAHLLANDRAVATPADVPRSNQRLDLQPKVPETTPRARAMISLFQHGGPSHMDLTDPKPELSKYHGTKYSGRVEYSFANNASKKLLGTQWKFRPHGQCGMELSELLPYTASIADELCLIRSMHTGANGHEVSIRYFHGGIPGVLGRPHVASWLLYGLGAESDNLPAYMVLTDPGGLPVDGTHNWSSGFLPPLFQGTVVRPQEPRILNLDPPSHVQGQAQRQNLDFLNELNRLHLERFQHEAELEARIASFELAAKMQVAATDAFDLSQETQATKRMYGLEDKETEEYGTRCLIARRLVERGVRFVQLFLNGQPWDNHRSIGTSLPAVCRRTDRPAAALVKDLKQRGLLDSTIVHWGGEIGRLPVTQDQGNSTQHGRDHNGQGFSIWMAGGGFEPGRIYGATDEFGHRAVQDITTPNDLQATLLHLFGLDWRRLKYHYNGRAEIVTAGRDARVLEEILV